MHVCCAEIARRRCFTHASVALQACSESRLFTNPSILAASAVRRYWSVQSTKRRVYASVPSRILLPEELMAPNCFFSPPSKFFFFERFGPPTDAPRPTSCLAQSRLTRQVPPPDVSRRLTFLSFPPKLSKFLHQHRPSDEHKAALRLLIESMGPLCFNVQRHKNAKRALC